MRSLRIGLFTMLAAFWLSMSLAHGQGVTTSAINGFVNQKDGSPVAGAAVTIVHDQSGAKVTTVTRANGQFSAAGLRPGGPYTVTVAPSGQPEQTHKDVWLTLGQTQDVNFVVGASDVVTLDKFVVSEERDTTFGSGKTGTTVSLDAQAIVTTPSIRQDPQDIANNDTRFTLVENTSTGEFQLSAVGQNFRYNSMLIDGVQSNDPFGLNGNGGASWFSPVPFDALEAMNISIVDYDIQRTGYTGAVMNMVTKSGTNDFHGSARYSYTGADMRAKNPVTHIKDALRERRYTFTFGGPIIKDKLFFFVAYEDFRREAAAPNRNFAPDPTALAQIIATAKTYGYDPGSLDASYVSTGKSFFGKLDWQISEQHRATVSYRRNESNVPQLANYNGASTTSLSNYWYQQPRVADSYQVQLESQWSPDFHTEAIAQYTKYDGSPKNNGKAFPEVLVQGVPGTLLANGASTNSGQIDLGTEFSRQLNQIFTKNYVGKLYGDYTLGNHTIKVGGDSDKTIYVNRFAQAYYGSYTFSNVANWVAGTPVSSYSLSKLFAGYTLDQAFAAFSYTDFGAGIQDTWRPNAGFMLQYGLRYDYPDIPNRPPYNGAFYDTFGFANNTTGSGNAVLAPRLSFNWDLPTSLFSKVFGGRKTQIRGGIGLVQGTNPAVWISNSYSNAGVLGRVSSPTGIVFKSDVSNQPIPQGSLPVPVINVTDPKFQAPSSWKTNLAIDHKLPWLGLVVTLEADAQWVNKAAFVESINIKPSTSGVTVGPDGRQLFNGVITPGISGTPSATSPGATALLLHPNFNTVYELTDTNKGDAESYTFAVERPMQDHWRVGFAYTRSSARDVNPFTSSVAQSNFNGRAYLNPNEEVASRSNYVVPDKFVVSASREFNFFHRSHASTVATAVFRAQTGHPYSWVFRGDANGDGFSGNDLFYVPTGPNDPNVRWANAQEETDFFNFVNSTNLKKYMGKVAPRNSEFSHWQKTLDLQFTQEIPIYHQFRLKAFVDILNIANLFNKNWGVVDGIDFPYERRVAGTTFDATANGGKGQYVYRFNSNTLDPIPRFADLSRWQVQVGAKLEF